MRNLLLLPAEIWSRCSIVLLSFLAVACASDPSPSNPQLSSKSEPLAFEVAGTDEIDVITLIDPERRRLLLPGGCAEVDATLAAARKKDERRTATQLQLECAFQAFRTYSIDNQQFRRSVAGSGDEIYARATRSVGLAIRRNEIQDRMILRSDALCRDFERRLNIELRIDNDTNLSNFVRNSQNRLVSDVGSLLLGGDIAWALANATRITDIPGYVHDESQIAKATMRIAIQGLKRVREDLYTDIETRRRASVRAGGLSVGSMMGTDGVTPVTTYSLERAIADALSYHSACSVGVGLEAAAQQLSSISQPTAQGQDVAFPSLVP